MKIVNEMKTFLKLPICISINGGQTHIVILRAPVGAKKYILSLLVLNVPSLIQLAIRSKESDFSKLSVKQLMLPLCLVTLVTGY